eukprot:TRINITY_DN15742_c0_g1_i1.p3 TRINITY_DN15742_c0_g1~~TRINITY_DN15742_c0_g1_i1.p3  ORF type:complete len:128 (-),score=17.92 TRINITY_DN15742_c0_g1_i1:76-459(-)
MLRWGWHTAAAGAAQTPCARGEAFRHHFTNVSIGWWQLLVRKHRLNGVNGAVAVKFDAEQCRLQDAVPFGNLCCLPPASLSMYTEGPSKPLTGEYALLLRVLLHLAKASSPRSFLIASRVISFLWRQ